ncbi:unnamed protein product [Heterobilharzia americana]|nr:unnamed protein product [Heterobilharzia americana]
MIDSKGNELGKLFIGGLSQSTNNDSLRLYFSRFGKIDKAIVMMDNKTGRSRGFGYIKYYEYKSVILTLEVKLHIIDGKQVDVKQFNINMKGCNRRNLKIFVGGISLEQDIESIKAYFKQYGHVTDVNLMMDINKQKHRGFAFVEFDNENVVKQLINLHYVNMNNKQVEIKAMEPKNFSRKVKNNHTLRQISTTITSNNNNNSGNICNLSSKNPSYTDISHFHEVYQHTNNPLNFTVNHLPSSAYSLHNHPFLPFQLNNQLEFLQPNTIRYLPVFYNHQQMNISDPAFPTLIHSNTDNYINTNNYLDDSFSVQNNLISEYTLQPIAFMNKPFTGNQSILQNSTNKSTTGKHSSTSVLSPLYITTLANVNPYHKINRVQVPPKHPSYIPPILTTNQLKQQSHSLFYSNIFNFQQLNPSVYTIQCELIPLHVISPSSNSMIKQSSCNNITPIVVCNDMPNNTDSGIFSTTSKNSSTKKEEQHITNDNLSKAISTASNTANALTTSGIVSISMDNTSTAVTLSSEATDSATTNTTNADATNLTKLKGLLETIKIG